MSVDMKLYCFYTCTITMCRMSNCYVCCIFLHTLAIDNKGQERDSIFIMTVMDQINLAKHRSPVPILPFETHIYALLTESFCQWAQVTFFMFMKLFLMKHCIVLWAVSLLKQREQDKVCFIIPRGRAAESCVCYTEPSCELPAGVSLLLELLLLRGWWQRVNPFMSRTHISGCSGSFCFHTFRLARQHHFSADTNIWRLADLAIWHPCAKYGNGTRVTLQQSMCQSRCMRWRGN